MVILPRFGVSGILFDRSGRGGSARPSRPEGGPGGPGIGGTTISLSLFDGVSGLVLPGEGAAAFRSMEGELEFSLAAGFCCDCFVWAPLFEPTSDVPSTLPLI